MKNIKVWLVLFAVILTGGITGSVFAWQKHENSIVEIAQNREVLYQLDLSEYTKSETIEITYDGGINSILIESGQIVNWDLQMCLLFMRFIIIGKS